MSSSIALFLKGAAMGAANVVPGVSGGTIALVTGIYERLINALRSLGVTAARLFLTGRFREFWRHIDGHFLTSLMAGVIASIFSLAVLLEYLLEHQEVPTMAFFFGLILLSVYYVGKTVKQWTASTIIMLLLGIAIAVGIALLKPLAEDASPWYVFICGVVAICSMILPGLSGSFVLIILGNYALVLGAISRFEFSVLIPLGLGCAFGLVAFSHLLALVYRRYHDQTVALMTGFILGSLVVIWPWKHAILDVVIREGKEPKEVVTGYEWFMPVLAESQTLLAIALAVIGALTIAAVEYFGGRTQAAETVAG